MDNYDILVVRDYYPSDNNPTASTWVYNQTKSLSEMGYSPLVISPTPVNPMKSVLPSKFRLYDQPSTKIEEFKGTKVMRPPYFKVPRNYLTGATLSSLSKCVSRFGELEGIKLIHAHFGQNGIASVPLKKKLGIPLITSFYGYDTGRLARMYSPYYKQLIKHGDLFLALSQEMKTDLISLGFPENRIVVHHLGIDIDLFRCSSDRIPGDGCFRMLTVARLDEVKGVQFVLLALNSLISQNRIPRSSVQYTIVGSGAYEEYLRKMISDLSLSDIVNIIDNLGRSDGREIVRKELSNCDVFALCSGLPAHNIKEGTPVVLMEAQSHSKPCIATYHAGIPEVVKNDVTGILVESGDVESIGKAILTLFNDIELRNEYGRNARRHIEREFNHFIQMDSLDQLYIEFIDGMA